MTAQEQQMIQSLADRINNTPLSEKDPDAEQFLQQALGRNPDALYILAQTTLVQQYALEQAQKQLADARSQLDQQRQDTEQPKHATSFLGNLLGLGEDHSRPAAPPSPSQQYSQPAYAPVQEYGPRPGYGAPPPPYGQQPQYGQPQYGQSQYGPPQSGGFLRSAMQTATGVAAGALAFEGIESLMHGFGGSGGGSGFGSGMGGGRPEEIVNNYYGDSSPGDHQKLSSDIEDRRGGSSFDDAVAHDDHHDTKDGFLDDANADDSGTTDDSGYDTNLDDGSSADDGGSDFDDSSSDDTNY
jgi:hypothetical protein